MKERPILFKADMVCAILEGRKTQTRRIAKVPNGWHAHGGLGRITSKHPKQGKFGLFIRHDVPFDGDKWMHDIIPCPYGQPGDQLWVREAIRLVPDQEPDNGIDRVLSIYDADGVLTDADAWPWRRKYLPSMHCPRGLSRIQLEIVNVRVERLQDISEEDAMAEGVIGSIVGDDLDHLKYRAGFQSLWESINSPGSWDLNPWVWVIEFKRIGNQPAGERP